VLWNFCDFWVAWRLPFVVDLELEITRRCTYYLRDVGASVRILDNVRQTRRSESYKLPNTFGRILLRMRTDVHTPCASLPVSWSASPTVSTW
jgi:hypothetical protein